jgi:uncharacterized protein
MRYDMDHAAIRHIRFTSAAFVKPLEITGFPVVTLWVSSSVNDASLFVYLLMVDGEGRSYYISEGILRSVQIQSQGAAGSSRVNPGRLFWQS